MVEFLQQAEAIMSEKPEKPVIVIAKQHHIVEPTVRLSVLEDIRHYS